MSKLKKAKGVPNEVHQATCQMIGIINHRCSQLNTFLSNLPRKTRKGIKKFYGNIDPISQYKKRL